MNGRLDAPETLQRRRIAVFLAVAFGVSWATALAIWATGGLRNSPEITEGITLATVLLPTAYMFGPAIGTVAARLATGEGWERHRLRPEFEGTMWTYAAAWLAPAGLTVVGAALYFAVFPAQFDPTMAAFREQMASMGVGLDPWLLAVIQIVSALTVAPLINGLFAFGEELGWRAYLLPKLLPLGYRPAVLLSGVIWGVWHWPILAMGYNYGFDYPGFPWTGMAAFLVFTVGAGTFLAELTVREGSVWPASVGHGAINAIAGIALLFVVGQPESLFGPTPVGVLAALPWLVVAAWLLRK
ncbi:CPBP family intramembrane metalloprotease [Halolamina sp. CBA1230]|uniref:CPBP family intramembrane glutamic endopeptidase n=1 Tax=Halolamina sp. CBA1230 TaxID=1853690 RepID=UPI0009A1E585|nr:CPBP family intramembrane glutamic endopeptidase [Halolamina sp. CBA1230]QKY20161.1 CPBP family intramembrane metalloprotease [Halolamina sp. CBA1230]